MITAQQLALQTVGMNPFYRVSAYPEAFPPSDRVDSFLRAALLPMRLPRQQQSGPVEHTELPQAEPELSGPAEKYIGAAEANRMVQPPASTGGGAGEPPLRPDDLPAAFWDAYPENADNPDLAAINALLEESTPEERADTYKVRHLRCGPLVSSTKASTGQQRAFVKGRH